MRNLICCTLLLILGIAQSVAQTRADRILREIENPASKYVVVVAHRGDWRNYPENSLEAIESAIAMGVDMVEIDIQRTIDGHLVLCHDASINRTTNGKGRVKELTLDSIRKCRLRSGHGIVQREVKMPTLEEALDLCKGRVLINIDKGYNYYDEIMPLLQERNMVKHVIIKSSKSPVQISAKQSQYSTNMLYMPIINYTAKRWEKHEPLFEEYLASGVSTVAYEICWDSSIDGIEQIFQRVIQSGNRLWINTLWNSICGGETHGLEDNRAIGDAAAIYGKVLEYGATMIQTDRPQLLIGYLDSVGRHSLK